MVTREEAASFAEKNGAEDAAILRTYWFPSEKELRLVHVDPTTLPSEGTLHAFQFSADPEQGINHSLKIAFVLPDEENHLELPTGWGSWAGAIKVYEANKAA